MKNEDWLYSEDRLGLREQCLSVLLKKYGCELNEDGTPLHSTESIYACAHDWVSQGHPKTDGIVKYYKAYYETTRRLASD